MPAQVPGDDVCQFVLGDTTMQRPMHVDTAGWSARGPRHFRRIQPVLPAGRLPLGPKSGPEASPFIVGEFYRMIRSCQFGSLNRRRRAKRNARRPALAAFAFGAKRTSTLTSKIEGNNLLRSRSALVMLPSLLSSMYARDAASAQRFSYCRCGFVLRKREALLRCRPIDRKWRRRKSCAADYYRVRLSFEMKSKDT